MAKKNKLVVKLAIIGVIILILVGGGIFYLTKIRPNEIRNRHSIGTSCKCMSDICIAWTCGNLNFQDWIFSEYSLDSQGNKITDKLTAMRTFANDEDDGLSKQIVRYNILLMNPYIAELALGNDEFLFEFVDCWEYIKALRIQGDSEPVPQDTWACVFDPNGIKQKEEYLPIITWNVDFEELNN